MGGEGGGRDTQKALVNTLDAQRDPDGWRLFVFGRESLQSLQSQLQAGSQSSNSESPTDRAGPETFTGCDGVKLINAAT